VKQKTLLNNIETAITSNNVSNSGDLAQRQVAAVALSKLFQKFSQNLQPNAKKSYLCVRITIS